MAFITTLLVVLSVLLSVLMIYVTRGISFYDPEDLQSGSDARKQVIAAANFGKWRWPSEMHQFIDVKARKKDVGVLSLVIMQKIKKDKVGFEPLLMVSVTASALSSIVILFVGEILWGLEIAIFIYFLYLFSVWPYQLMLLGGYQVVSQLFALLTVLFLLLGGGASLAANLWYVLSGCSFCLMCFASASSRKYVFLVVWALFFSVIGEVTGDISSYVAGLLTDFPHSMVYSFALPIFLVGFVVYFSLIQVIKYMVYLAYYRKGPNWLSRLINDRNESLELKVKIGIQKLKKVRGNTITYGSIIVVWVTLMPLEWVSLMPVIMFLVGFSVICFIFVYPDIRGAIKGYFQYSDMRPSGHFNNIREYFNIIGENVVDGFRAQRSGWQWIGKYFVQIIPIHVVVFCVSMILYLVVNLRHETLIETGVNLVCVVFISLSPIIIGEITRGPQIGRSYFPGFLGILIGIGFATSTLYNNHDVVNVLQVIGVFILILTAVTSSLMFFLDILPSRMVVVRLNNILEKKLVRKLYTYKTKYNRTFVNALSAEAHGKYSINEVNTISEATDGYFLVPDTSWKTSSLVGTFDGITSGDFDRDPLLNKLLKYRKLEEYSVARLKNWSSSRIWIHEDEVTSYRALLLRDIDPDDHYRSFGWLINICKLKEDSIFGEFFNSSREFENDQVESF